MTPSLEIGLIGFISLCICIVICIITFVKSKEFDDSIEDEKEIWKD